MQSKTAREIRNESSTLDDPLYPEGDAADELNLSPKTLQAWRVNGCGPRFVKLGRRVFYRASDLRRFIEANTFQSTAEVDHARSQTKPDPRP
jgi:hypothetical protein